MLPRMSSKLAKVDLPSRIVITLVLECIEFPHHEQENYTKRKVCHIRDPPKLLGFGQLYWFILLQDRYLHSIWIRLRGTFCWRGGNSKWVTGQGPTGSQRVSLLQKQFIDDEEQLDQKKGFSPVNHWCHEFEGFQQCNTPHWRVLIVCAVRWQQPF